ncbi:MAG: hypothetical protein ACLTJG_16295 [[Clostridium] innocuum]
MIYTPLQPCCAELVPRLQEQGYQRDRPICIRTAGISAIPEGCREICMGSMMTAVIYVDSWAVKRGTGYRPEGNQETSIHMPL